MEAPTGSREELEAQLNANHDVIDARRTENKVLQQQLRALERNEFGLKFEPSPSRSLTMKLVYRNPWMAFEGFNPSQAARGYLSKDVQLYLGERKIYTQFGERWYGQLSYNTGKLEFRTFAAALDWVREAEDSMHTKKYWLERDEHKANKW